MLARHPTAASRHFIAPAKLNAVLAFVEARLPEKICLDDLAGLAHCSPYHFCRIFRSATGFSPYQYVIHRRVERAKALLDGTDLPLSGIAHAVGFQSQRQFAAMFTAITGMSPGRFRQRART